MQPVEQAVDRHLVELPLVNGVNVVVGDMRQHVLEQARLAVHRPHRLGFVLQQPAAADQRDRHDAGDKEQLCGASSDASCGVRGGRDDLAPCRVLHGLLGLRRIDVHDAGARRVPVRLEHPLMERVFPALEPVPDPARVTLPLASRWPPAHRARA